MKKQLLSLMLFVLVLNALAANPKYIFLFIGDGMSIPQRTITEEYLRKTKGEELLINHLAVKAATRTSSNDNFITDSAASGTAIACGEKTRNGCIGMSADLTRNLTSSAEAAREAGMKVGIVTSVTINHATPAAFYGHRPSRGQAYELGLDLIASNFDYFGGGGLDKPNDDKNKAYKGNIYELAAQAGYKVAEVKNAEDMAKITRADGKVWIRGSNGALQRRIDAHGDTVQLSAFVEKGIELLDNPKGFFMMCEGGAIDWGGHANDAGYVLGEALALNEAVKVAYAFGQKHPEETLIVVTGDHETGGLSLGLANTGITSRIELLAKQKRSYEYFNSRVKNLVKDNPAATFADVRPLLVRYFDFKFEGKADDVMLLTADEIKELETVFQTQFKPAEGQKSAGNIGRTTMKLFSKRTGLNYSTGSHSALPVITTAWGAGSEIFTGKHADEMLKVDINTVNKQKKGAWAEFQQVDGDYENSDISLKIKSLIKK